MVSVALGHALTAQLAGPELDLSSQLHLSRGRSALVGPALAGAVKALEGA